MKGAFYWVVELLHSLQLALLPEVDEILLKSTIEGLRCLVGMLASRTLVNCSAVDVKNDRHYLMYCDYDVLGSLVIIE